MEPITVTQTQLIRKWKEHIEFEDDPHRAALEDNPESVHVPLSTWAAIFVRSDGHFILLELH